jgi:septum site-determining protein MinD
MDDIVEILSVPLIGVIPESGSVLQASNSGNPVIMDKDSTAGQAYMDVVERFLGADKPLRFINVEQKKGFFKKLFG